MTLAAARGARGTSTSVVVINENGTVSTGTNPAAAQWVSPSAFVASSLETGRIGYIVAWGGNEYGYAYTYALSGAPAGVTIDVDTGILSIGSPLSPRAYSFSVRVTNREVVSNVATFPITLTVVQGVTALRTGNQILHKTYDPLSGAYGTPIGNNYTAVLNKNSGDDQGRSDCCRRGAPASDDHISARRPVRLYEQPLADGPAVFHGAR